jgi:hypothetical protein
MNKQRKLAEGKFSFETGMEELLLTGELMKKVQELTDRQIGQLVFDTVWDHIPLASTAMSVIAEATHRLFRSPGGSTVGEKRLNDPHDLLPCPKCGEPMMFFFGIDEPDFKQCVSLKCAYKEPVLGLETRTEGQRSN